MNIKQEYKDEQGEHVSFTYIGDFEGATFDGNFVIFRKGNKKISFYITEIEELIPYFQRWVNETSS